MRTTHRLLSLRCSQQKRSQSMTRVVKTVVSMSVRTEPSFEGRGEELPQNGWTLERLTCLIDGGGEQ